MKTILKIIITLGAVLLAVKGLQILIDVLYEQSNSRYITVEDED